MPMDVLKNLEAIRKEAEGHPPDVQQAMALQRIAASLECIRGDFIGYQHMMGVMARTK
jgi:hypothetical protein